MAATGPAMVASGHGRSVIRPQRPDEPSAEAELDEVCDRR